MQFVKLTVTATFFKTKMIKSRLLIGCFTVTCLPMIFGHDLKGFDDTILFNLNWPGKGDDLAMEEPIGDEPLIVTSHNKEKYKCFIPNLSEAPSEPQTPYTGPGNGSEEFYVTPNYR